MKSLEDVKSLISLCRKSIIVKNYGGNVYLQNEIENEDVLKEKLLNALNHLGAQTIKNGHSKGLDSLKTTCWNFLDALNGELNTKI